MEINQDDRDRLRAAQHNIQSQAFVGNLIEHKIQDPKAYKSASRGFPGFNKPPAMPDLQYKSFHYNSGSSSATKSDSEPELDKDHDLPIGQDEVKSNLWLNMDCVEHDKLSWMSGKTHEGYREQLKATTRFDIEGRAIPPGSEANDTDGQVHDLPSLVKLLDSTCTQQVTYALRVVTRIADLAITGFYDGTFDENIHQLLVCECLLRARHHMDSPNETIRRNAIQCLRTIICNNQIDEIFLDQINPLSGEGSDITLWLLDESFSEFNSEMTDKQCVQNDAISTLVGRTGILTRVYRLIADESDSLGPTYNQFLVDILIRIARHSINFCYSLNKTGLTKILIDKFLLTTISNRNQPTISLATKVLKFVRILSQASKELESSELKLPALVISPDIVKPVQLYYNLDCCNLPEERKKSLFLLHIETIRLMKTLGITNLGRDMLDIITLNMPLLCRNFQTIIKFRSVDEIKANFSIDWQYVAHLLDLIGFLTKFEERHSSNTSLKEFWNIYVGPVISQWLNDIMQADMIPHLDVSIALATVVKHLVEKNDRVAIMVLLGLILGSPKDCLDKQGDRNPTGLQLFNRLARAAQAAGQITKFSQISGQRRDPKMLPSFGSLNFNSTAKFEREINPVIKNNSPFILLDMFIKIFKFSYEQIDRDSCKRFVDNLCLIRYLRTAAEYFQSPISFEKLVQQSRFAQMEVHTIANSILLLSRYYQEERRGEEESSNKPERELALISKQDRVECYSSLFFTAFSIVGLMNPGIESLLLLKDQILEEVLLNQVFHAKLECEKARESQLTSETKYRNFGGDAVDKLLTPELVAIVKPIYLACDQSGRFWLFQPIVEHYQEQIIVQKRKKVSKWFADCIKNQFENPLENYSDTEVISSILIFSATVMRHVPSYNRKVVQSNLEEFLCFTGTTFLDDRLFLDEQVSAAIKFNLKSLLPFLENNKLFSEASKKIQLLELPLADFFNKLVENYEAASYGDAVFSNFLLLFLNPNSDKTFKKILWSDKVDTCLSQMRIPTTSVWASPILFDGKETDSEIKTLMRQSLAYLAKGSFLRSYVQVQLEK